MTVNSEEYQKEYDAARADLDAAAEATTARGADGKFVAKEEAQAEPVAATTDAPAVETPTPEPTEQESLAELRERVAKAEKMAKDNQAWATRLAQERAQERREREAQQREANKPAILDANPELAEAIRYVAGDPAPKNGEEVQVEQWRDAIAKAHRGIFGKDIDPDLETAIKARWDALGEDVRDPLVAIREVTAEKIAHAERLIGQRFAAEAAKQSKVSAMSVPGAGAGGGSRAMPADDMAEVKRIQNMSNADFAKMVKKARGY